MNATLIIIVVSGIALVVTVFAIVMVIASLGDRHHRKKSGNSRKR